MRFVTTQPELVRAYEPLVRRLGVRSLMTYMMVTTER